ncbi:MAG TPA: glycosyltransferase family 2 protein [bacterium]|nr:glycosyltransferase family 2 protein [bacterium]HPN81409.1 glycosyltransferase family 2 protein [bacterium]HPW39103.1 glycosyltransferase family 2 protein [bacterium]
MKPDLSIVIVSWQVKDLLKKCLKSIEQAGKNLSIETWLVDNASSDGSVAMARHLFPQMKVIANRHNLGFARANNQALRQIKSDYVLILNPDTELREDTLIKSLNFMKQNPQCGIMGCQIINPDGSLQPSIRRLPTIWPIFLLLIKAPKFFSKLPAIDKYLATDFDYTKEQKVEQVMGAFMVIKKELLDKIGLFDEKFFVWFEEVDLCRRTLKAGYQIIYNPEISMIHYGGASFNQQKTLNKQWRFFKSAFYYFIKKWF